MASFCRGLNVLNHLSSYSVGHVENITQSDIVFYKAFPGIF